MPQDRGRRAYEILAELQMADRDSPDRAEDLAELGTEAIPALREALALRSPAIRRVAAAAMARIASPHALPSLLPLLEQPDADLDPVRPVLLRGTGEAAGTLRRALARDERPASGTHGTAEHAQDASDFAPAATEPQENAASPDQTAAPTASEAAESGASPSDRTDAAHPPDPAPATPAAIPDAGSAFDEEAPTSVRDATDDRGPAGLRTTPPVDTAEDPSHTHRADGGTRSGTHPDPPPPQEADAPPKGHADGAPGTAADVGAGTHAEPAEAPAANNDDAGTPAEPAEASEAHNAHAGASASPGGVAPAGGRALEELVARARNALSRHADHPSPFVRAAVADALGALGDAASADLLTRMSGDGDTFVSERARGALASLAGPRPDATTRRAQAGDSPASSMSSRIADDEPPADLTAILASLTSPDPQARRQAGIELIAHPAGPDTILRYMGSSHTALRRAILELLCEHEIPAARERIAMLLDAAWPERDDLIWLLRAAARHRMVDPAFLDRQIRRFLMHHDVFLRAELAGLVAASVGPALDVLPRLLRDREFHVREQAGRQWLRRADRHRSRIVPDVLDLVGDILDQPQLYREDVMLLVLLLGGLRRAIRDGAFVEERVALLTARCLGSPFPPLRRRAAELLETLLEGHTVPDPGRFLPLDQLLLSREDAEVQLALRLLERSGEDTLRRNMPTLVRYLYRADDTTLVRLAPVLARAGTRDGDEALRHMAGAHPSADVRSAAEGAMRRPAPGWPPSSGGWETR